MKKKIIRYILCIATIVTMVAGCGSSENTKITEEESTMSEVVTEVSSEEIVTMTEIDDEQKKMMAEGNSAEQPSTEADNSNEIRIGDYDISIICPKELTVKSKDASYGELVRTSYYSNTCEKERKVNILLPAGYSEEKRYPVMYVLHGIFGDENSMVGNGTSGIPITLGNMMNEGIAKEMIVVFPYMYASKTKDQCTAIDIENILAYDNFVNDLVDDLMPFMEANYSVAVGKENTAITGFSMGGREALAIGLQKPDLFGYVGSISAAPGLVPGKDWAMEHPGQFSEDELVFTKEAPFLVMVCCGDKDRTVGTFPKSYHEIFDKNGVEHIWWEIPGSDHGDPAITSGIYNFAKEIFK